MKPKIAREFLASRIRMWKHPMWKVDAAAVLSILTEIHRLNLAVSKQTKALKSSKPAKKQGTSKPVQPRTQQPMTSRSGQKARKAK